MDLLNQLMDALVLAIPVACIVWTITHEEICRDVQDALKAYQKRQPPGSWRRRLAYMPSCPYCLSHYVAAVFIAVFGFKMLSDDWRGYLVSLFAVVLIANTYLSAYHLLRVALRAGKAYADRAEANAQRAQRAASTALNGRKASWRATNGLRAGHGR